MVFKLLNIVVICKWLIDEPDAAPKLKCQVWNLNSRPPRTRIHNLCLTILEKFVLETGALDRSTILTCYHIYVPNV